MVGAIDSNLHKPQSDKGSMSQADETPVSQPGVWDPPGGTPKITGL